MHATPPRPCPDGWARQRPLPRRSRWARAARRALRVLMPLGWPVAACSLLLALLAWGHSTDTAAEAAQQAAQTAATSACAAVITIRHP
jgi:hypothetical protein